MSERAQPKLSREEIETSNRDVINQYRAEVDGWFSAAIRETTTRSLVYGPSIEVRSTDR